MLDFERVIVLLVLVALSVFLGVRAYKASHSGSKKYDRVSRQYVYSSKNVPFFKTGYGILFAIATAALIISFFAMLSGE